MQNRFDTGQPEIIRMLPIGTDASARMTQYFDQQNTYREMSPGEHDFASTGFASLFMSRRGTIDMFAGAGVTRRMNRDNMDIQDQAPTQSEHYLTWQPGTIGDERRVGIVKRWTNEIDEFYVQDQNGNFRAESFEHLANPAGQNPAVLYQRTEGHVYDQAGNLSKQFSTQNPLRHQTFFYTDSGDFNRYEIDVNGNSLEIFSGVATIGKEIRIPQGNYKKTIGIDRDVSINRNELVKVGNNIQYNVTRNVGYTVGNNYTITAGSNGINVLNLNNTSGSEQVSLETTASGETLGFQAQNSGGGVTKVLGPSNSSMVMQNGVVTVTAGDQSSVIIGDGSISAGLSGGSDSIKMSSGLMELMTSGSTTMSGQTFSANFTMLNLGTGAAIPAVLGLAMLTWLDSHTHTGNLGYPTGTPITPASTQTGPMSLISNSIMLMPNI
jgi:hypothetical protein